MSEDLISRAKAISILDRWLQCKDYSEGEVNVMRAMRYELENLPSAQQWIPVSSGKLPEELQEVNITWVNHRHESYYEKDIPFNGSAVYYKGRWYWYSQYCVDELKDYGDYECDEMDDAIEVIAWTPLPEPFREGSEA